VGKYKKERKRGFKKERCENTLPEKSSQSKRVSLPLFERDTVDRWIITLHIFFELRARTPKASCLC
jgi:hypothetical protein